MASLLIDLHDAGGQPHARLGGKAHTLARLARAGLPVPAAVVVPPEVADADLERVATALEERFGAMPLAVRSSADVEDGQDRSWAGLFRTELRVRPADAAAAIRRVRASRSDGGMAVLVMAMVDARVAGVAFTADPVTGDPDCTVVEAVAGTAEGLMEGRRLPVRWRVTRERVTGPDGRGPLAGEDLDRVVALAAAVEDRLGHPVDVEWACDGEGIQLLQARPITSLPAPFVVPSDLPEGTWIRDDDHFPRPLTRLTGSVLCPSVSRGLTAALREVGTGIDRCEARLIDGYYYQRFVPAGVPERWSARGGPPPPALAYGLFWRLHPGLRRHARAARAYVSTDRAARVIAERRERTEPSPPTATDELPVDLRAADDRQLADQLRRAARRFDHTWRAHMEYAAASRVTIGQLLHEVTEALDVGHQEVVDLLAGHGAATRRLTDDLAPVRAAIAGDPAARAAVAAGDVTALQAGTGPGSAAYRAYVQRHGGLLLAVEAAAPTLAEAPELLLPTLATPGDAVPVEATALAARIRAHPDARRLSDLLERARWAYAVRDRDLLPTLHALADIRRGAREAGRRLADAGLAGEVDDVFHLDLTEVTEWLDGAHTVTSAVLRERRRTWERAERSRPPAVVGPPPVPPPSPRFLPRSARMVATAVQASMQVAGPERAASDADGSIVGTPACAGVATGVARVVRDPRDLVRLAAGEVLVCQLTTVAWAPAFARAAAVVTSSGGLLSHPAIQAREHGVPTVVGVVDAMEVIPDGATVRVDGTRGTVEVVSAPADGAEAASEVDHETFDLDAYQAGIALTGAAVLEAADATGLWARLERSPATADELSARTGMDPAGIAVVLRAMTSLGVAGRRDDGRYVIRQSAAVYRRARERWGMLADALRGHGDRRPAPYEGVVARLADRVGDPAGDAVEQVLGGSRRVLDLGAGAAPYTRRLARAAPDVELTLVDHAPVLDQVRPLLVRDGTADRTRLLAGDLFELDLPGGQDLVVVANVLHLLPDDGCRDLLRRATEALAPGGRVAVIEPLPDESMDGPVAVALYAVGLYLRAPAGGVRTFSTYAAWLSAAGLVDVDRHDLGWAHLSCVTGRARDGDGA